MGRESIKAEGRGRGRGREGGELAQQQTRRCWAVVGVCLRVQRHALTLVAVRVVTAPLTRLPRKGRASQPTFVFSLHFTDSVYHAYSHSILVNDRSLRQGLFCRGQIEWNRLLAISPKHDSVYPACESQPSISLHRLMLVYVVYHAETMHARIEESTIDQPLYRSTSTTRPSSPDEYHESLFHSTVSSLNHQTGALCSRLSPPHNRLCSYHSLLCYAAFLRRCHFPRNRCLPRYERVFHSIDRLAFQRSWTDNTLIPMSLISLGQLCLLYGLASLC